MIALNSETGCESLKEGGGCKPL